jgi:FkbM family methyltransferase
LATHETIYMTIEQDLAKYSVFSNSQLNQDIFVLLMTKFKKEGFFVEFGACDGLHLSNTYILEKLFKWNGLMSEPAKLYHQDLIKNRNCIIETDAVYSISNAELEFQMVHNFSDLSGLIETINDNAKDKHRFKRNDSFEVYTVNTISLTDFLKKYNAPKRIDYMSVDTEGSEYEILKNFDFNEYQIDIITVEHNYFEEKRNLIKQLLEKNGFVRVLEEHSQWDDWYVQDNILKEIQNEEIFNNSSN